MTDLLHRLPTIRGHYRFNYAIGPTTWFRVGGPSDVLYKPADSQDLSNFLKNCPDDIVYTPIGVASNVIIRDGGLSGVTIKLGKAFNQIVFSPGFVDVGASVLDRSLALIAAEQGCTGLEFFASIPGTIGGALAMNAGCYGTEVKDVLQVAFAMDNKGKLHKLSVEDLGLTYRHCQLPHNWIFTGARFRVRRGRVSAIQETIAKMLQQRADTQPIRERTGGSTFANPPSHKAWELIDQAGCRGMTINDAQISNLHCNFMINNGQASAYDLEFLGETVRKKVMENSNVALSWEIKRLGRFLSTQDGSFNQL